MTSYVVCLKFLLPSSETCQCFSANVMHDKLTNRKQLTATNLLPERLINMLDGFVKSYLNFLRNLQNYNEQERKGNLQIFLRSQGRKLFVVNDRAKLMGK